MTDLRELAIFLGKDSELYKTDVEEVLTKFSSFTKLPIENPEFILPYLTFFSDQLKHIQQAKLADILVPYIYKSHYKERILKLLKRLKNHIEPEIFYKIMIENNQFDGMNINKFKPSELPQFLKICSEIYTSGTEKQKKFCFLNLIYLYESRIFKDKKLILEATHYEILLNYLNNDLTTPCTLILDFNEAKAFVRKILKLKLSRELQIKALLIANSYKTMYNFNLNLYKEGLRLFKIDENDIKDVIQMLIVVAGEHINDLITKLQKFIGEDTEISVYMINALNNIQLKYGLDFEIYSDNKEPSVRRAIKAFKNKEERDIKDIRIKMNKKQRIAHKKAQPYKTKKHRIK